MLKENDDLNDLNELEVTPPRAVGELFLNANESYKVSCYIYEQEFKQLGLINALRYGTLNLVGRQGQFLYIHLPSKPYLWQMDCYVSGLGTDLGRAFRAFCTQELALKQVYKLDEVLAWAEYKLAPYRNIYLLSNEQMISALLVPSFMPKKIAEALYCWQTLLQK
jgi:hypothetical protein